MVRKVSVSARRYAQTVFELALKKKGLTRCQSDLEKVVSLSQDTDIVAYLENPKVRFEDKTRMLSEKLRDVVDPLVLNLVYLLLTKSSLSMLTDIADEYQLLIDSHKGVVRAEVITAIPLDDEDKLKLSQRLGNIVGKKVILEPEVDPDIIGGVIVRVGGKLLDGSIRSKLAALKRELH